MKAIANDSNDMVQLTAEHGNRDKQMKRQMEKDIRTFHRVVGQLDDDIHNSSNRITRSIDIPLTLKHTVKISEVHNCYKLALLSLCSLPS